jgi:GNAT superfamily N-acetyltransferase
MQVRSMEPGDLDAARALLAQLGYERPADEFRLAFAEARSRGDHELLVAEEGGRVVGWVHAVATHALHEEPFADIAALVVEEASRRNGAGTTLMRAIESWAREKGCAFVRVRSRLSREGAHRFYVRLGYAKEKTQYTFAARLR